MAFFRDPNESKRFTVRITCDSRGGFGTSYHRYCWKVTTVDGKPNPYLNEDNCHGGSDLLIVAKHLGRRRAKKARRSTRREARLRRRANSRPDGVLKEWTI